MGYVTDFTSDLQLLDGVSVEDFVRIKTEEMQKAEDALNDAYLLGLCTVANNGFIEIFESAKYDFEYVWVFLARVAQGTVWAKGEDDEDIWKVEFKGGRWKEVAGNIFYGELLDEVFKRYEEQMPDELKHKLHAWWDTQRLLKGV